MEWALDPVGWSERKCPKGTLLNLGMNDPKICPEDFMAAVRFLRVCGSPLKWLEV